MSKSTTPASAPRAELEKARPKDVVRVGMNEVGYSGLNQSSGTLREEFLGELRGKSGIRVFREMSENDAIIGAILFAVGMLMRQATWRVVPNPLTPTDQELADFVNSCREDMSMTWNDVISEVMTMLPFGWSLLEMVYKKREGMQKDPVKSSRFSDGKLGWAKMPLRSQDSLDKWTFNRDGAIAMTQKTTSGETAVVPLSKCLLFRTQSNKNNPEGRSILRNAYRSWYFKKRIEEIEGVGIERDLAGLPVMTPPENLDIWNPQDSVAVAYRQEAETIIRNIRRDEQEGVLLPFGWTLTLLSTGGRRSFDTSEIISRYDHSMAMSVMADFIVLGHNNRYGSFALAGSKTHMFGMAIGGWLDAITEVFNRYAIPHLLAVNGIVTETPPVLEHGDIETPDLDSLGNYIQKLSGAGFKMFPNEVLEKVLLTMGSLPTEGVLLGQEKEPAMEIDPLTGLPTPPKDPGPDETPGGAKDPGTPGQRPGTGPRTPGRDKSAAPPRKKPTVQGPSDTER